MSADLPSAEEITESRRQALLQKYVDGARLTPGELELIADLIERKEPKAKGRKKSDLPSHASVVTMAGLFGISGDRLRQMAAEGRIPAITKEGMLFAETIRAVILDFKNRSRGKYEGEEDNKRRRETAEANTAEIAAAKSMEEVVIASEVEPIWLDAAIKVRAIVEAAEYLKPAHRTRLIEQLSKVKVTEE